MLDLEPQRFSDRFLNGGLERIGLGALHCNAFDLEHDIATPNQPFSAACNMNGHDASAAAAAVTKNDASRQICEGLTWIS